MPNTGRGKAERKPKLKAVRPHHCPAEVICEMAAVPVEEVVSVASVLLEANTISTI